MNKKIYQLISFTWGLPLTLLGVILFLILKPFCKIEPNGLGYCIHIGHNWGGFSLGPFSLICKDGNEYLHQHEFGHSIQNCIFGPFTIFFITIPSIIRYWGFQLGLVKHDYYYIWFEAMASWLGQRYWQ